MKKILYLPVLFLFFLPLCVCAQIEGLIVETYYISDDADATDTTGGGIAEGTTTYRIYVDLKAGSKIKKIYGDQNHPLKFSSTADFFNNKVDGQSFAKDFSKNRYSENTVALDTWLTLGQTTKVAANTYFGILKDQDSTGSFIGGANNDGGSEAIVAGLMTNADPLAGIPLTNADGMDTMVVVPESWADYGIKDLISGNDSTIFGSIVSGSQFISYNAGLFNSGVAGVFPENNQVLVAQLTTMGDITFELNLEVEEFDGLNSEVVKYVANDSVLLSDEILSPFLKYPFTCGCTDTDYLEFNANYACGISDSCRTLIVLGCTDTLACNFNPSANLNIHTLCCYVGLCADRDISLVCPDLKINTHVIEVDVFPNPAGNTVNFFIKNTNQTPIHNTVYSLFNSVGELMLEKNVGVISSDRIETIDVSNYSSGLYFVRIASGDNYSTAYFIKN